MVLRTRRWLASTSVWLVSAAALAATTAGGAGTGVSSPGQAPPWATRELRAGIIGTDTSHVPQFTALFESHPEWKIRVVAAFKGGSPDLAVSANRLEGFARTISEKHGVELVDSIDALLAKVDVVLLESVDGRPHLSQVTPVFAAKKPVFIDKPLAASLEDVRAIVRLAEQTGTPFFSASSVRFHPDLDRLRDNTGVGKVTRVEANYVLNKVEFHPDLYYYGIHGVEALYEVMGTGCATLSRSITPAEDITTCTWSDGRVGVYRGTPKADPSRPLVTVTGEAGTASTSGSTGYEALVLAIAEFFHTGRPPVDVGQTVEVFEFMTAADLSKARNGAAVRLEELRVQAPASGADISGPWRFTWDTPGGPRVNTIEMAQTGDVLTAKMDGQPLTGTIKSGRFELGGSFFSSEGAATAALRIEGQVDGGRLVGSSTWGEYAMTFTAVRPSRE